MKPEPGHHAIRVLIAEDEKIVATDLARRLESLGYPIVGVAGRGEDAIRLAFEDDPDIILMDVHLGGELDGVEAATRIRGRGGPPVVFATAYSDRETLGRARSAHPFGYILKPFQDDAIQATIEIAVCRWNSEREILQREDLLRSTMSVIGEAVVAVDESLLVTFMNATAEKITGWQLAEALTSPVWDVLDLYAPDGSELQDDPLASGTVRPLECLLKKKLGTTIGVTVQHLKFDRRGSDEPGRVFIISKVPGHIVRMEGGEREAGLARQFESAFLRGPLPSLLFTVDQGAIIAANDAFLRKFGFARPDILSKSMRDLGIAVIPPGREGFSDVLRAEGQAQGIRCDVRNGRANPIPQLLSVNLIDTLAAPLVIGVFQDVPPDSKRALTPDVAATTKADIGGQAFDTTKNDFQIIASLLQHQAESIHDEEAKTALLEWCDRVQSLADIQETLRSLAGDSSVEATKYLREIAQQAFTEKNAAGPRIGIDLQIDPFTLEIRHAAVIGLIIRELITSALKHAFPGDRAGTVSLTCRRKGQGLVVVVADDGVGDISHNDHQERLGMRFVRSLAEKLDGNVEVTHIHGTEVQLSVPEEPLR